MPPDAVKRNIFEMSRAEKKAAGITALPANLLEAVRELEKSEFMKEVLGDAFVERYVTAKRAEWGGLYGSGDGMGDRPVSV